MILLFFAKERLFSFGLQKCFDSSITCSKFRLGLIIYQSTYGSVILPDELEMSEVVAQMIAEDKHKRGAAFHTLILNPTTQKIKTTNNKIQKNAAGLSADKQNKHTKTKAKTQAHKTCKKQN